MTDLLAFFLLGLGGGAIYAALGVGIVLTHRASGVVNFAHGAMSLYVVYLMAALRSTGDLVLPIGTIHLGDSVAFIPALCIAVAYAGIQSVLIYLLCFAPLHAAPALAKVVASVGVMVGIQSLVLLRFGSTVPSMAPILPNETVHLLGVQVPRDRFWLVGIVIVGALGLAFWANRTRFGKVTRAAAENETAAHLLGFNPVRIALLNWLVAGVFAGGIAIVIAPVGSLESTSFTLLVIPAVAAALVGRLSSLVGTAAAGLVLGGGQSVLLYLTQRYEWLPQYGLKEGLPFVLVVAIIFFAGRSLPARGALELRRLPSAAVGRLNPITIVAGVAVPAIMLLTVGPTWRLALITSMVGAIFCLGLVVLTGFIGQISLAHMALAGVAGFALSKIALNWGVPFPVAPLLAAGVAVVLGVVIGIPALRVRGLHLAIVSIAAAQAIQQFIFANPAYTGGLAGTHVPEPKLFGIDLGIRGGPGDFPRPAFGFLVLVIATACFVGIAILRRSDLGHRLLAVRSSERAAAASGISVARMRLVAIVISSGLAGVGGCLLAYQRGQISYNSFDVFASLLVLTIAYLGGIGVVRGAIVGGIMFTGGLGTTALENWLHLGDYQSIIFAGALVLTAIANPDGLAGTTGSLRAMTARVRVGTATRRLAASAQSKQAHPDALHGIEMRVP